MDWSSNFLKREPRASGPPNFVTSSYSRVVMKLNFTANSPNLWITYGVICVTCGYNEVCISFTVSFFAAPFLA